MPPATPMDKYSFVWNDTQGGLRIEKATASEEECSSVHKSAEGYVVCRWLDGMQWVTDVPNLVLDVLARKEEATQGGDEFEKPATPGSTTKSNARKLKYCEVYKKTLRAFRNVVGKSDEEKKAESRARARKASAALG